MAVEEEGSGSGSGTTGSGQKPSMLGTQPGEDERISFSNASEGPRSTRFCRVPQHFPEVANLDVWQEIEGIIPASATEGSNATAAATGDEDTAMTEATSSTSTGGAWGATGTVKEPERKTPEKDQPFTDAGMAAKEQLDKEREELRGTIFQRTLELASHHEDLVFEVRDAFSLVSADHDRATDSIQALLGIVMSAGSAAYGDQEKQVAVRMHALAVILNDDKLFKSLDDDTTDTVMNVSMMLLSEYESRPQQEAHTAWFASALESQVVAPPRITPEQDRGPVEKILPNLNKLALERETLLSFTLAMLSKPATLKKDDITDTGIDPTFLEALPDEMREEVLNQHFRERRAAATTAAAANSNIAPEFLEALPPEIRAEVIQQEQLENARRRTAEAG
ncbi:E3 ubiquitin-protein ligase tom1 [Tilletia horrida]|nr:E3 ubiquitin-protein ligase tom1 [Tilletia horrida]